MKHVSILMALLLAACGEGDANETSSGAGSERASDARPERATDARPERATDARPERATDAAWVSGLEADAERGERVYETCASCHALTDDPQEPYFGPHLARIYGRPIAADPDYAYSAALQQLEGTWTRDRLAEYLLAPRSFVPGTTMVQALPDSQKVADVLAFIRAAQDSVETEAGR